MSSTAPPPAARKLPKPLVEQRRRARLNHSLERLRLLLLAATRDQRLRNPKAEKAEILQKTVQFLRAQPQADPPRTEELFLRHYRSGYRECLARAARFLQAAAATETPPTRPGTPSSLSPPAVDTPGPPSRHGPSTPWAWPVCRRYGPGHHCHGPAPRPTPRPDCTSCHGNSTGCLGDPSCCPSNGAGCHGDSSRCPSYHVYRPGFGPGLWPSTGPTPRPDCAGCHGNSTGCLGDPPCRPSNGVSCHGDSSMCPSYHGYRLTFRPSLRPSSGPTFRPTLRPSSGPHHSPAGGPVDPIGGPIGGPVGSPEDSWWRCTKEGQGISTGGLPGPHHVWRPWP